MAATPDGTVHVTGAVFEAKFMLPWSFSDEGAALAALALFRGPTPGDPGFPRIRILGSQSAGADCGLGKKWVRSAKTLPPFSERDSIGLPCVARLTKSHAHAAAIFIGEFDAGGFERSSNNRNRRSRSFVAFPF